MARLGVVILLGSVLPGAIQTEMVQLLQKSNHGPDSSYFTRPTITNHLGGSQVIHGKIGLGPHRLSPVGGTA